MKNPSTVNTRVEGDTNRHLVFGGGGTKSILAGIGAFCGIGSHDLDNWRTVGGISGGSIPSAFIASGIKPKELLRLSVRTNFQDLLEAKRHPWRVIRRYLAQKDCKLPIKALMSSEPLGEFIDELIPEWPERFWTMAMADIEGMGRCQIVFTADGIYRYNLEGELEQLADTPPSVGTAVRATCAIPGVISSVQVNGLQLFDGMLTWDGACPVGVVGKHFDAEASHITAVDVGVLDNWFGAIQRRYMRHWSGKASRGSKQVFQSWVERGITYIETPEIDFGAIKLDYDEKQKWAALRSAYATAKAVSDRE